MNESGHVNIRGRDYKTVALRVTEFWQWNLEQNHRLGIESKVSLDDGVRVVCNAEVKDAEGRIWAEGHAEEQRDRGQINQTSALENCETSAIGRALACLGFGGTEFSSADELTQALVQQGGSTTAGHARPPAGQAAPSAGQVAKPVQYVNQEKAYEPTQADREDAKAVVEQIAAHRVLGQEEDAQRLWSTASERVKKLARELAIEKGKPADGYGRKDGGTPQNPVGSGGP